MSGVCKKSKQMQQQNMFHEFGLQNAQEITKTMRGRLELIEKK